MKNDIPYKMDVSFTSSKSLQMIDLTFDKESRLKIQKFFSRIYPRTNDLQGYSPRENR